MPNPSPVRDYPGRGTERAMMKRALQSDRGVARDYFLRIFAECGCNVRRVSRRMRVATQRVYAWMNDLTLTSARARALAERPWRATITSAEELTRLMDDGRASGWLVFNQRAVHLLHAMFDRFESQAEVARQLEVHWRTLRRWMTHLHIYRRGTSSPTTNEFVRAMRVDPARARVMLSFALTLGTLRRAAVHLHVTHTVVLKAIKRFGGGSFYPQGGGRRIH